MLNPSKRSNLAVSDDPPMNRSPFSSPMIVRAKRIQIGGCTNVPSSSSLLLPAHLRLSVRSLDSIGMGSTDGKRLTIKRFPVPASYIANTPTTPGEEASMSSSYWEEWDSSCDESCQGGEDCHVARANSYRRYRPPKTRGHWANKIQFILACVGYSVGLTTIWRFPYLCYTSGGGVFLIPYYLILITCGIPLLYMELAIGQFTKRGPIGAFSKLCPLFKGAGLSNVVVSLFASSYYNVIIAYCLYYLFTAFRAHSPWSECSNRWNTPNCWKPSINTSRPLNSTSPAEEFFENKVLQVSDGIEIPGEVRWELAACLLFSWILVYFALWKSVKSSGRVLYFTATLPFLLILAFLGRSLTLDGANLGLEYLFKPRWHLLMDAKVWINAAAQNFQSIGIAFGTVVSFASYNRQGNQILIDTLTVSAISAIASLVVGIFAFATLGSIAKEQSTSIDRVISDSPGMVFIIYPEAMSKMPLPSLWALLFFFMLLCLGLNSQFAIVEVVVTSVQDGFPNWIKKNLVCHEILVLFVCCIAFSLGIPYITQGGIYVFQMVDHYVINKSVLIIAFWETIAIGWCYGSERLALNLQRMTNQSTNCYFKMSWIVVAPLTIVCLWIFSLIDYEVPTYNNGAYVFPTWTEVVGWAITLTCVLPIPILAVYVTLRAEGKTLFERVSNALKPQMEDYTGPSNHHHKEISAKEMSILVTENPTNTVIND